MTTETEQMVNAMSNYVNSFGSSKYTDFAQLMGREHRTLQQSFTKLCVYWLKYLSCEDNYDARNEASVEFAKSIREQLADVQLPTI